MRAFLLVLLASALAWAADPLGDWYGTLHTPRAPLRLVLHLVKGADGKIAASMDSIDQGAMALPAGTASIEGGAVRAEWTAISGILEARLSADGAKLSGSWIQGSGSPLHIEFTRTKFEEGKPTPLDPADRDFLLSHLDKSRQEFLQSIEGLNEAQWKHKPAGGGWSIAECAEHLTITEEALLEMVRDKIMKVPVRSGPRKTRADDEKVIARMTDRSQKAKAPEMLHPTGKWPTPVAIREEFLRRREATTGYVKSTQEDMRGRVTGQMDAYQYLVMLSSHTLRHTAQLNEVKRDAAYPK